MKTDSVSSGRAQDEQVPQSEGTENAPRAVTEWDHKDEWRKFGRGFMVIVSRHNARSSLDLDEGPHRWCVYAYIYPKHPYFARFNGPHMWQEAATRMPLHGYPSLLEYPMYDGKITSVKVGADYNHLHDDRFTHYATQDDAAEVFSDADELFVWLSDRAQSGNCTQAEGHRSESTRPHGQEGAI